jgi:hypothetical protein
MQAHPRRFGRRSFSQVLHRRLPADDEMVEEDGFLGLEVTEDGAPADRGGLGDLVDRRLGIDPAREECRPPVVASVGVVRDVSERATTTTNDAPPKCLLETSGGRGGWFVACRGLWRGGSRSGCRWLLGRLAVERRASRRGPQPRVARKRNVHRRSEAGRTWAVESAGGLGYLLSQQLVAAGETVLDVPSTLAARIRLLGSGRSDKNDPNDATSTSAGRQLQPPPLPARPHRHRRLGTDEPLANLTQELPFADVLDAYERFDSREQGWTKVAIEVDSTTS